MEIDCKKTADLCKEFLDFESADDLSSLLSRMMGTYIANAPIAKKELANASYVISRLTSFVYNLDKLNNVPGVKEDVLMFEDKKECSRN